jgi:hypothetical protein
MIMDSHTGMPMHTRTGNMEGYAALLVLIAYVSLPALFPDMPFPLTITLSLGLSGLGLLLGSWGIRFGRGRARVVAWTCLVILLYLTCTFIIIALNH